MQQAKDETQKLKLQKRVSKTEGKETGVTIDEINRNKAEFLFSTIDKLDQVK